MRGYALGDCDVPLVERYDAALYDLDGVLYLGDQPIPHAAETVVAATAAGMRPAYVTNNASRRPATVAEHLTALGIPAEPADVVTSAQAAVSVLRERIPAGSTVLVVGSTGLADEVEAGGFRVTREAGGGPVGAGGAAAVSAVVQGYDRTTGWAQLAEASVALRAGALWVATNTDSTLPSPRGPLPGNGAMVAALRVATGLEPLVAGKPEPALHLEAVQRVAAQRPLVVGDRLDTDVLGAVRGGADSLLVLTGVVDVPALLAAPAGSRPTYVAVDLRGLLAPQLPVTTDGRCGGARALYCNDQVEVEGEGSDALRAACAVAWAALDEGHPVAGVTGLG